MRKESLRKALEETMDTSGGGIRQCQEPDGLICMPMHSRRIARGFKAAGADNDAGNV